MYYFLVGHNSSGVGRGGGGITTFEINYKLHQLVSYKAKLNGEVNKYALNIARNVYNNYVSTRN